jgi:hypothetical protein
MTQLMNLPINIPWRLIAVSSDMMDREFCDKEFPPEFRSSIAFSVYEPDPDELPREFCGDRVTYIKVTTTITGYQPSKEETGELDDLKATLVRRFPTVEPEFIAGQLDDIAAEYYAAYGALLNIAVFPYPNTRVVLREAGRIDLADLEPVDVELEGGEENASDGSLPNPLQHANTGVTFEAVGRPENRLIDISPPGGDAKLELSLQGGLRVSLPQGETIVAIELAVAYSEPSGVTVEAFAGGEVVERRSTRPNRAQPQVVTLEADSIDEVLLTSVGEASLLEFAYFTGKAVPLTLQDYPHVVDFQPKTRDLYQAATESGEILSSSTSSIKTDKSFTSTEETETGFAAEIPIVEPNSGKKVGSISGKRSRTDTDQETWAVGTDASRERREVQGTSTQITQMYNLLTGYHLGTNRSAFLMLARPHSLQPTDFRTFVQGLRAIEGTQEFFLVVSRPEYVSGLSVEAFLETGHYPEGATIIDPQEEYEEEFEDFVVTAKAGGAGALGNLNPWDDAECVDISSDSSATRSVRGGWVVDKRVSRQRQQGGAIGSGWDTGHAGVADLDQASGQLPNHINYQATEEALLVSGEICGDSNWVSSGDDNVFRRTFRVFTRSMEPRTSHEQPRADVGQLIVTSRGLCARFRSGDPCPVVVGIPRLPGLGESIVDEAPVLVQAALLTRGAQRTSRVPVMKDFLRQVQTTLTSSSRSRRRRPYGASGFLDSDYVMRRLLNVIPPEQRERRLADLENAPEDLLNALGAETSVEEALTVGLERFARRTELSLAEAAEARYRLLGVDPPPLLSRRRISASDESQQGEPPRSAL